MTKGAYIHIDMPQSLKSQIARSELANESLEEDIAANPQDRSHKSSLGYHDPMFGYQKSTQSLNQDPWDARAKKIQKEDGAQWLEVTATRLLRESESVEESSGTRKYENLEQAKSHLFDQMK